MRLCSLHIHRLPGIHPGFGLEDIGSRINIITGPNASGKSSILRAFKALLYKEEPAGITAHLEGVFQDGKNKFKAFRIGPNLHWESQDSRGELPEPPDYRFFSCFVITVDELLSPVGTDAEIAERIHRELAGGYNLRKVLESPPFFLKKTHGQEEYKRLTDAQKDLRKKSQEHRGLQSEEAELERLRTNKEEAESAALEANAYRRALDLLGARRNRLAKEKALEEFHEGIERLKGDEMEVLHQLREQRERARTNYDTAQSNRDKAQEELRETGLSETCLDEAVFGDRRRQIQRLQECESSVEKHETALRNAKANLARAVEGLGGERAGNEPKLTPDTLERVEGELEKKRKLEAQARQLDEELSRLPESPPEPDPQKLRSAREALIEWLSAPKAPGWTLSRIGALVVLVLCAALAVGAAAMSLHLGFAILILPLGAAVFLLFRGGKGKVQQWAARERFQRTGLPESEEWKASSVQNALNTLDRKLVAAEHTDTLFSRRKEVHQKREGIRDELSSVLDSLKTLAGQVGFDPTTLDASFERWIRLVQSYDQSKEEFDSAQAAYTNAFHQARELREEIKAFLKQHGESPTEEAPSVNILSDRLELLAKRFNQRSKALREINDKNREIQESDKQIQEIDAKVEEVFNKAGLGVEDENILQQRIAHLPQWNSAREGLQEARGAEIQREQDLGERPDLEELIETDDEATLQKTREELEEKAKSRDQLAHRIAQIETRLERARYGRELEEARAKHQAAEDSLRERLDEALFAKAGSFLLEQVEAEHVSSSRPEILRRAQEWFRSFTRHQFELELDTDREPQFTARETNNNERRSLMELSSGTRMQLLLAVRIAFALEAEKGKATLPVFLDEALTASDPDRFRAVVDSLRMLTEEDGRQMFYLTAQPDEAQLWEGEFPSVSVHRIDLGQVRSTIRAVTEPVNLTMPHPPMLPEPGDLSPEDYAVRIGVSYIDLWSDVRDIHLFYLLRDDLNLLKRLVEIGVDRIGPLLSFLNSETSKEFLSVGERRCLTLRESAAESWLEGLRQGLGRPVDRTVLEDSGMVSPTFIDRVAEQATLVKGDAKELLQGLERGDVKGFRSDKREQLREWFREQGYLDERDALSAPEVQQRMFAAIAAYFENREFAFKTAQFLFRSLTSVLPGGA